MSQMNIFYVYVLFDWLGVPRYVGKGTGKRWRNHFTAAERHSNKHLANIFAKARRLGFEIIPVIIRDGITEADAFAAEIALIKAIGRKDIGYGPLVNKSDGGTGGNFGEAVSLAKSKWTEEERERHRQTYRQSSIRNWARLSPEERSKWAATLVQTSMGARLRLRAADPAYEDRRIEKIKEGHSTRTLEQKRASVAKQIASHPPEKRSLSAALWHSSRTPEERSATIKLGWEFLSPTERSLRARGSFTSEQRSAQVKKQQAELTSEQILRRSLRAQRLGSGTRWINNGAMARRFPATEPLPEGWAYGKKLAATSLKELSQEDAMQDHQIRNQQPRILGQPFPGRLGQHD